MPVVRGDHLPVKTPEQTLTEWTTDRIEIHYGHERHKKRRAFLTRVNVEQLCNAIMTNSPSNMLGKKSNPKIVGKIAVGGRYASGIVYWPDAQRVAMLVIQKGKNLTAAFFSQFHTISEIAVYLSKLPDAPR